MTVPLSLPPADERPPERPARALRALGSRPRKHLSQSFLRDATVAQTMVRAAALGPEQHVLEIGPGLGFLTRRLLPAAGRVTAIEIDQRLAAGLPGALGNPPGLTVVHADALHADLAALVTEPYLVVASLPYHVASPLLLKLAHGRPRPVRMVVLVQLEVAERIAAPRGAWTFLTAALALVVQARLVRRVLPGAFYPPPKVTSAVLQLDTLPEPAVDDAHLPGVVEFLKRGFTQPRRQLHNSLALGLGCPPREAEALVRAVGIAQELRPGQLDLEDWLRLAAAAGAV